MAGSASPAEFVLLGMVADEEATVLVLVLVSVSVLVEVVLWPEAEKVDEAIFNLAAVASLLAFGR